MANHEVMKGFTFIFSIGVYLLLLLVGGYFYQGETPVWLKVVMGINVLVIVYTSPFFKKKSER